MEQQPNKTPGQEQGSRKRKIGFTEIQFPQKAESSSEEKIRRQEVAERVNRINQLDREFFVNVFSSENLAAGIERREVAESLAYGTELSSGPVGNEELGINAITKRIYEGNPDCIAYVKPQSGEASFKYDATTGKGFKVKRHLENGQLKTVEVETAEKLSKNLKDLADASSRVRVAIAANYGVSSAEVPLHPQEFSPRVGVGAGDFTMREYAVSRIDQLIKFDLVPLTVLRAEQKDADVLSVQECARSKHDPEAKPREMDEVLYQDLKAKGPDHPGAKSFMRLACLDYLVRSHDRHPANMLYLETYDEETDTMSGEFKAIDNGLSLGLSRIGSKMENGISVPTSEPVDAYWSIPMELVQEHNQLHFDKPWQLDDEAVEQLKRLYEATRSYLAMRETGSEEPVADESQFLPDLVKEQRKKIQKNAAGKEIKFLTSMFRELYGNEKIAKHEALEFFRRIGDLINLRRPPELPVGSQTGSALAPVRVLYKLEQPSENIPVPKSEEDDKATRIEGGQSAT